MLRIALVAGLIATTFTPAEARGFRVSFRGFGRAAHAVEHRASASPRFGIAVPVPRSRTAEPVPAAATADPHPAPLFAVAPSAASKPAVATVPKAVTQTAEAEHWCDTGAIVGHGKGFCVLR